MLAASNDLPVYTDGVHLMLDVGTWGEYDAAGQLMVDPQRRERAFAVLHRFAAGIGLRRSWFQRDHYDLTTPAAAERAIRAGALLLPLRDLCTIGHLSGRRLLRKDPNWCPTILYPDDIEQRVAAARQANLTLIRRFAPGHRVGRRGVAHLASTS